MNFEISDFFGFAIPLPDAFQSAIFKEQSRNKKALISFNPSRGEPMLSYGFETGYFIYSDKRGWLEKWETGKNYFLFQVKSAQKGSAEGRVILRTKDGGELATTQGQLLNFIVSGDSDCLTTEKTINYPTHEKDV